MPDRPHHSDKMRQCVDEVMAKGHDKSSAYAICTTSLQESGQAIFENAELKVDMPELEPVGKVARHIHLLGATGQIRTASFDGRDHLVVPVIALLEGVIHAVNAATPEFVPLASLASAPAGWNGRPVMRGHPVKNGKQISANEPTVLQDSGIGVVFQSHLEGKKLSMEAWIDQAKAEKIGATKLLQRLRAGETVEVSVGAFVVTDDTPGVYNGKAYQAVWKDIVPDHLAFLEDKVGACSVAMGCGTHRMAEDAAVLLTAEEVTALSPLSDKANVVTGVSMKVGDKVKVNKPGHAAHGKVGVIKESMRGGRVHAVKGVGTFHKSSLVAAQDAPDTPEEAASEEAAELIGYQTMKSLLDQVGSSHDQIMGIVDELIADETENPTETPEEEDAEEEVESARLEAIQALCMSMYSALNAVMSVAGSLLEPEPADTGVSAYAAKMTDCLACNGTGSISGNPCEVCDGVGQLKAAVGKRNSASDMKTIQGVHDYAMKLGAKCDRSNYKTMEKEVAVKTHVETVKLETLPITTARDISQKERDTLPAGDFAGPNQSFPIAKPEDVAAAAHSIGRAKGDPEAIKKNIIAIAHKKGAAFVAQLPDAWKTADELKAAELKAAACSCEEKNAMETTEKTAIVKALVSNRHSGFTAADEGMLLTASDDRLEAWRVAAEAREKEVERVKQLQEAKPLTEEDFMRVAPPEIRTLIDRTRTAETTRKAELVDALKAAQSEYTESELSAMSLEVLERTARLANIVEKPDYSGRAVPRSAAADAKNDVYANPPDPYAPHLEKHRAAWKH